MDLVRPVDYQRSRFAEAMSFGVYELGTGLVVAADDLLRRRPRPSDPEIREALAGNLCRCTGYEKILDAVRLAAERMAP